MGCTASKNSDTFPPIDSNFANTSFFDLDVFFLKASQLLQRIETLRHKIFVTKQQGSALAGTTNVRIERHTKAVEVLFWALSADRQGDISKNNLIISEIMPFVSADTNGLPKETADLLATLQEYMSILNETPENIKDLVGQLQALRDEQIQVRSAVGKLPPKGLKVCNDNMRKLHDGFASSAKVLSHVPEEQASAVELIKYMRNLQETANEVGAKAFAAGLAKPIEIFKWTELEKKKAAKRSVSTGKNKGSAPIDNNNQEKVGEKPAEVPIVNPNDVNVQTKPVANGPMQQSGGVNVPPNQQNQSGVFNAQSSQQNNANGMMMQGNGIWVPPNNGLQMAQSFGNNSNQQGKPLTEVLEKNEKNNEINKGQGQGQVPVNNEKSVGKAQTGPVGSLDDMNSLFIKEGAQSEKKERLLQNVDQNASQKGNTPAKVPKVDPLHGEENIDDEVISHAFANDSVMIRHFIEKAHSYLELKD